jgi:hypothetical protein
VSRLERATASGSAGQGFSTTRATWTPAARGLERQQRVVDRAQAGAGDDDGRQRELAGQVPHGVGVGERQEHSPAPSITSASARAVLRPARPTTARAIASGSSGAR